MLEDETLKVVSGNDAERMIKKHTAINDVLLNIFSPIFNPLILPYLQ
jgi:hypothetical protein